MTPAVAITGRAVISRLGEAPVAWYDVLCRGGSGLAPIERFDTSRLGTDLGGELADFDPKTYLGRKIRPLDRTGRLVAAGVQSALRDAARPSKAPAPESIGLVVGTMYGSVDTISGFDHRAVTRGPIYASPMDFANSVINAAAGQAAIWHGLTGPNSTISTGLTSGLRAVAYAADLITSGQAGTTVAGGVEELCLPSYQAFDQAGILCGREAPRPVPFDRNTTGIALAEGAAFVVLESVQSATDRGSDVLALVLGSGEGFDPQRGGRSASLAAALEDAIRQALAEGDVEPGEIAAVIAGANGSAADASEAKALARTFDGCERPVSALAGALGTTPGAHGGLQIVGALELLRSGQLPGVAGLKDPLFDVASMVSRETRSVPSGPVLLTALSIDGQAAAVVIGPPENER